MCQMEIVGTILKNGGNSDEESPALNPASPRRTCALSQRENELQKIGFLAKLLIVPMR